MFTLTEQPFGLPRLCFNRYFPGSLFGIAYRGEYVAFSMGGDKYGPKIRPWHTSLFLFSITTNLLQDFFTFKSTLFTGTFGQLPIPMLGPCLKPDAMNSWWGIPINQSHKRFPSTGFEMLLKNYKTNRKACYYKFKRASEWPALIIYLFLVERGD